MNDILRRAVSQVLASFGQREKSPDLVLYSCPFCKRQVSPKDWVSSFRLQPDGGYSPVELCRACRDSGI